MSGWLLALVALPAVAGTALLVGAVYWLIYRRGHKAAAH